MNVAHITNMDLIVQCLGPRSIGSTLLD